VLPFLEFGPSIHHLLDGAHLERVHPRLAAALAQVPAASLAPGPSHSAVQFTARELSLLAMLPTHLSYAEMGERLYLSVNTIKTNLKSVYRKLGANTRAQAVALAREQGLH
jgi:LuxR family maltose regulon positive regulatory protein